MQDKSLRAQLGIRYEEEERTSTADTTVPTNTVWSLGAFSYGDKVGLMTGPATYTGTGSNDYVLPSLNVTFEHAENRVIKFAASKTIARPALEQMDVSVSTPASFSWMYPATLGLVTQLLSHMSQLTLT